MDPYQKARAINSRLEAYKAAGKDADSALDSVLKMDTISEGTRNKIKQAKASGQSQQAFDDLLSITSKAGPEPVDTEISTGPLGGAARFLGIEKLGKGIGTRLAMLDPQHRRNLEMIAEQNPAAAEELRTGGVNTRQMLAGAGQLGLNVAGGAALGSVAKGLGATGRFLNPMRAGARALNPAQQAGRVIASPVTGAAAVGRNLAQRAPIRTGMAFGAAGGALDAAGEEQFSPTQAALQAGTGAALGGAVGSLPGARNLITGSQRVAGGGTNPKKFSKVVDLVSPKISGKEGEKILGSSNVTIDEPGLFRQASANFMNDPETLRIAETVADVVEPGKSFSRNQNLVKEAITDIAEKDVKPFLQENKVPFNFEDLRNRLSMVEPTGSLKSDASAFKNYNRVREEILDDVAKFLRKSGNVENQTDLNELWNARKVIDSRIENELGSAAFDSPQYVGVKAAARDIRNGLNNFIVDSLSNPGQAEELNTFYEFLRVARSRGMRIENQDDAMKLLRQQMGIQDIPEDVAKGAYYKFKLNRMSDMYDALGNLTKKAKGELGKSKFDLALQSPTIKTLTNAGIAAGSLGGLSYLAGRTLGTGEGNEN